MSIFTDPEAHKSLGHPLATGSLQNNVKLLWKNRGFSPRYSLRMANILISNVALLPFRWYEKLKWDSKVEKVHIQEPPLFILGHDHGAATLQLMMKHTPHRIRKCILTNAEAYDQWPSAEERPYVKSIVNPLTTTAVYLALRSRRIQRDIFSIAVADPATLDEETLYAFTRPHLATWRRWQRLRRFFRWQLDPQHNQETMRALDGMRRFTAPTLILWGARDGNFGRHVAERLAADIPGAVGVRYLPDSAHLPMLEQPEEYARIAMDFLA